MAIIPFPRTVAAGRVLPAKGASVLVRGIIPETEGAVYAGRYAGWGDEDNKDCWYLTGPMGGMQYYYADAYRLETLED